MLIRVILQNKPSFFMKEVSQIFRTEIVATVENKSKDNEHVMRLKLLTKVY